MVIFRKDIVDAIPSITPQPNSRVKRVPDRQLSFNIFDAHKNLSRKYFKDGEFYDSLRFISTPSGKMFAVPSQWASSIEIEDLGAESGKILETKFLKFMSEIGVPRRDILKPAKIVPSVGNREEEFSDGVILFGDTAFLLQMKQRNSTEPDTYASPDKYRTLRRNIETAKTQYYRSLDLAKNSSNNMVKMESISGETRLIDIEKYNWVSIVLTNRNYFGETDKPLIMDSSMNSPKDFGLDHVNHVILTLQGVVNLFNLFSSHYGLLSYLKMLSMRPRKYELCAETSLANDVYGKFYGLEDNSLRFMSLITKAVNQFFNDGIISKSESASILEPLYSSNNEDLEELFVNIENNFNRRTTPLFAWDDTKSKYLVLLDYAGKVSAIADKETYLEKYENYRPDELPDAESHNRAYRYLDHRDRYRNKCGRYIYPYFASFYHKKYSDKDNHLSVSDIDSFAELNEISISINRKTVDKNDALNEVLENFTFGKGNSAPPKVLKIIENEEFNLPEINIIVMGDIIFVPQIVEANIEDGYVNSMFSEASDLLALQTDIYDCSEFFIKTLRRFEKNGNLQAKNNTGETVNIPFYKHHWVSLIIAEGENATVSIRNPLYLPTSSENPSTILISMDDLSNIICTLEHNEIIYDFFRRISIRPRVGYSGIEYLSNYTQTIGDMNETKTFITHFNQIVLGKFEEGYFDKHTVRKIFSIFDNMDDLEFRKSFSVINSQIQKTLRISDRFTFSFENPYVFVFFTVCNGLTTKEKHSKKLIQELISKSEAQTAEFIVGILSDIVQNKHNGKHAMVTKVNPKPQKDLHFSWNSASSSI